VTPPAGGTPGAGTPGAGTPGAGTPGGATGATTTSTTSGATTTTTTSQSLPSRLEVDENDQGSLPTPYSLSPSHNPVAAGKLEFNVYNFGQDGHTFAIHEADGHQVQAPVAVPAGQSGTAVTVNVTLRPGTYVLLCTLPGHAGLGMHATLTVQ